MTRISELERVDWTETADEAASELTAVLRSEYGTQRLRAIQGASLLAAGQVGGLYCQARVGAGKTLIAALLPVIWGSLRPLILVPGSLVDATIRALESLRSHWQVPRIRVMSYSALGHPDHAKDLEAYRPDGLICDEARRLKRVKKAAVAMRVARYMHQEQATEFSPGQIGVKFAALDGTPTDESLFDDVHLICWALRQGAPVPLDLSTQAAWASVLDVKVPVRGDPATLIPDLGPGCTSVLGAREAFRDRLRSTPGVVISVDSFGEVPLTVRPIYLEPPPELEAPFEELRRIWAAPDGWLMADARFEVYDCARQLAQGFYYRHDPWPPEDWWKLRKAFAKMCRTAIETVEEIDSAAQAAERALRGDLGQTARGIAEAWLEAEPTFTIRRVPTWLSDYAVRAAEHWGQGGGVIWTGSKAFARELARRSGWAYFGEGGLDDRGRFIEDVPDRTVIVSSKANFEGRNLQYQWCRNLDTRPATTAQEWEQKLGRTHREGQTRPVLFEFLVASREGFEGVSKALRKASFVQETRGQVQKILSSGLSLDPDCYTQHSAWSKTQGTKKEARK